MEWTDSAHALHQGHAPVIHTCKTDELMPWENGFVKSK